MTKNIWILLLVALSLTPGAFAQAATESSALPLMLDSLGSILSRNLEANTVLGIPVTAGDLTLVPIVTKCFGMGLGEGIRNEDKNKIREKQSSESSRDRQHACGGLGGSARPVAILMIKKDGSYQMIRLQPDNWIAQGVQALVPVFQNMINKRFEIQLKRQQEAPRGAPPAPPAPSQPGR